MNLENQINIQEQKKEVKLNEQVLTEEALKAIQEKHAKKIEERHKEKFGLKYKEKRNKSKKLAKQQRRFNRGR